MKLAIRLSLLALFAVLCVAPGAPSATQGAKNDPWAGFFPGSWITVKEVERFLGNTKSTIVTRKITARKEGLAEVWNFTKDGSRRLEKERAFFEGNTPETLFMTRRGERETSVRVGTASYRAKKVSYVPDGKFSLARGPLTLYITDGLSVPYREMLLGGDDIALPENVIRAEYVAPDRNTGRMMRYESQIVFFYWVVSVGNEEIPCFVEETKVVDISSSQQVGEAKRWLSSRIPGHTVKLEYRFTSPYGPGEFTQEVQKYHLNTFRRQLVTMGRARISFDVPGHFRTATGDEIASRYPLRKEKTRAFVAEGNRASIIVQVLEPSALVHTVEDLKLSMDKQSSRKNPNISQISQGLTEINNRTFVYREYINTTQGSAINTYNLETLHRGKIISLDFTMSRELYPEYEQLWRVWVESIRIESREP